MREKTRESLQNESRPEEQKLEIEWDPVHHRRGACQILEFAAVPCTRDGADDRRLARFVLAPRGDRIGCEAKIVEHRL